MISTHVLDLMTGRPASGVVVTLSRVGEDERMPIAKGVTDKDGRIKKVGARSGVLAAGVYELTFETGAYFARKGITSFHPRVTVTIAIRDVSQHYHVPLLLSPYGYTTYRGS